MNHNSTAKSANEKMYIILWKTYIVYLLKYLHVAGGWGLLSGLHMIMSCLATCIASINLSLIIVKDVSRHDYVCDIYTAYLVRFFLFCAIFWKYVYFTQ